MPKLKDMPKLFIFILLCISFIVLNFSDSNFVVFRLFIIAVISLIYLLSLKYKRFLHIPFLNIIIFLIVIFNSFFLSSFQNSLYPLLFFFILIILPQSTNYLIQHKNLRSFKNSYILILLFSYLLLVKEVLSNGWGSRFSGFTNSATTFSTYLLAVFTFYLFFEKRVKYRNLIIILTTLIIIFSQTRTSLLLLGITLLIFFYNSWISKNLKKIFLVILFSSLLYYPITTTITKYVDIDPTNRYEEQDYSRLTRLVYFNNQIEALKTLNYKSFLLGKGIKASEKAGTQSLNEEILQHNDFFTLLYDFGAVFFIIYIYFLYRLIKNPLSLVITTIYLFSFYHNMLYDIYIVLLISIASGLNQNFQTENIYQPERIYS